MGFQTLELSWILIQILDRILENSNKEGCSLFNSVQVHILFEIFQAREVHLLLKSIQAHLNFFE
jgi:hypothetical protein